MPDELVQIVHTVPFSVAPHIECLDDTGKRWPRSPPLLSAGGCVSSVSTRTGSDHALDR